MLRVVARLAVGILLTEYLPLPAAALWTAVGIGLAGLVAGAFSRRQWVTRLFLCGLWITLIGAGGLLVRLHLPDDPFRSLEEPSRTRVMQLRLTDTPHPTKSGYKVPVEVEAYVDSERWCATHGGLMLFLPADSTVEALRYGQRIMVRGTPRQPSGEENPGQFDYQRYLRHRGILWQCRLAKGGWVPSTAKETPQGFKAWTKRLQWTLVQRLRHSRLTPSQQGIAEAMLLGWRDDTDMQTTRQFREAGIAHLLCVSGLHVGIVALLAGSLLSFLGRRRWQRAVKGAVQTLAVWLFVCLTGLSPSALRAGVMFTLLIAGDALAQRPNSANNLATSAVLLLCLRPMLLFDVGFQLSYAAVAGIIIGYKPIYQLITTPPLSENWMAAGRGAVATDMPFHRCPVGHPAADALLLSSIPALFPNRQPPYRAFRRPAAGHDAGRGGQLRVAVAV